MRGFAPLKSRKRAEWQREELEENEIEKKVPRSQNSLKRKLGVGTGQGEVDNGWDLIATVPEEEECLEPLGTAQCMRDVTEGNSDQIE